MPPRSVKVALNIVVALMLGAVLLAQNGIRSPRKTPGPRAARPHPGNPDAEKTIRRIDIDSTIKYWAPLLPEKWSAVFIHRDNEGYSLVVLGTGAGSFPDGQTVDAALIEALHAALNEPPIRKPDLKNLVANVDWFKEYISASLMQDFPPAPKQSLSKTLPNLAVIQRIARKLFNKKPGEFADDHTIRVTVVFDGDSEVSFTSGSGPFMLPWDITRDEKEITSYNANISRTHASGDPAGRSHRAGLRC